ncbi:TonB-dependent receptor [Bacteroides sp.]
MQKLQLIVCFLICTTAATAQHKISGTIYDTDKEPLIGATVTVKEKATIGATTDIDGHFTLMLPDNKEYTLKASFVGYGSKTQKVKPGQSTHITFHLEEDLVDLGTVVVTGTRTPKLLKDAPIITRVITMDEIKKVDATHIGDLLQSEMPGIEFSYSMNQQVSLNMQGFGGNAVLFLVDGERLAGETMDNIDYNRLNMDNVERIEIVKGAASSLYGSNAVGGVVNVISQTSRKPWSVNLNSRWGAHGEQRYGGTVGFNAGKLNSMTNVQRTSIDSYNMKNEGDYSTFYGSESWNFKERLVYTINDNLKLTGRAGYFFRERDSQPESKDRYRDFSGGMKANYSFNAISDLEVAYSFDQYDKGEYLVKNKSDLRDYSNVQHSVRTLYNYTFNGKHTLTVGGDYMRDYLMTYQFKDNGNYVQHTVDAFGQFDWNPTEQFNVILGTRFDYYSKAKIHHFSPKLGLMYKIGNCSLRGSYAGGFRAPTLKEMYMTFDMANIFMIYGNPDLKAETSHNFSLSAEYTKSRYNFTVTGFYNLVDNRISTAWSNALKGMFYTNMSQVKIVGVDANAAVRYPCGISARLSYAYTHEHIKKGEPFTSQTRPHTATARLEYDKKWNNYSFNLALNGRYLSKVTTDEYTSSTSYEETVEKTYPAYTMWKLTLSQKVWKGISVSIAVDNLFNYVPSYYYNNSPSTTGTTFSAGVSLNVEELFGK